MGGRKSSLSSVDRYPMMVGTDADPSLTAEQAGQLVMMQILLIGLGAGIAAALLFASVVSGAPLSLLLAHLAPLPILIVALGWSHWAGLTAALSAAAGIVAVVGFELFLAFVIGVGVPAWWLGYLALLARPSANGAGASLEWYPVGRLLLWATLIGTTTVVISLMATFGTDKETFQAGLRHFAEEAVKIQARTLRDPAEAKDLVEALTAAAPRAAAILATLINILNLWLAARVVRVSGRLARPWPDLAALTLPGLVPLLLGASIAGLLLPDIAGIVAAAFAAGLIMVYAIVGLAVLHFVTRGSSGRGLVLGATYASIILFAGLPILPIAVLGLAETAFNIRGRFAKKGAPPGLPT